MHIACLWVNCLKNRSLWHLFSYAKMILPRQQIDPDWLFCWLPNTDRLGISFESRTKKLGKYDFYSITSRIPETFHYVATQFWKHSHLWYHWAWKEIYRVWSLVTQSSYHSFSHPNLSWFQSPKYVLCLSDGQVNIASSMNFLLTDQVLTLDLMVVCYGMADSCAYSSL